MKQKSRSGKENTAGVQEGTMGNDCLGLPHLLACNISYDKPFLVFFFRSGMSRTLFLVTKEA